MKRLILSVLAALYALVLAACSVPDMPGGEGSSRENRLGLPFEAAMTLTLDRLEAQGTVKRTSLGDWEAVFETPNSLSGVTLSFSRTDGTVTASYKGLTFSVPKSAYPVKAMLLCLINAVEENAAPEKLSGAENEGMLTVNGSLDSGDYTLTVDAEGLLSRFEMPGSKLDIRFTEVNVTGEAEEMTSAFPVPTEVTRPMQAGLIPTAP
ncbi:MAG: hypothetical protein J5501_10090 [Ruminococcus sp.]|nr:hypothetical protein [Ruminococcus sp.]